MLLGIICGVLFSLFVSVALLSMFFDDNTVTMQSLYDKGYEIYRYKEFMKLIQKSKLGVKYYTTTEKFSGPNPCLKKTFSFIHSKGNYVALIAIKPEVVRHYNNGCNCGKTLKPIYN